MEKKTLTIVSAVLAAALVLMCILFFTSKNSYAADLSDRDAQIAALNTDVSDRDSQISALTADVDSRNAEIETLNTAAADKDAEIEALNAAAADKDAEIEALNAAAADKDAEIEALNAAAADKDAEIEALAAQITDLEDTVASYDSVAIPGSVPGAFDTTRSFLYALERFGIEYTYEGLDRDGDDSVVIYDTCAGHSITIHVWFMENDTAAIRVWDLITFNSSQKATVTQVCNRLNTTYRYASFTADDDNTVTLSFDCIFRDSYDAGEIALEGLLRCINILGESFSSLEPYDR